MRLLADENFSAKVASWLRSLGHDVRPAAKSTADPMVAAQAKTESRVILTHDADFADEEICPPSVHAGIMLIRINPMHADKIKSAVARTLAQIPASDWDGRLLFVFEDASMEWKAGKFLSQP